MALEPRYSAESGGTKLFGGTTIKARAKARYDCPVSKSWIEAYVHD